MRRRETGFTILELMFTIAIIAVLAGIAMPSFFSSSRKAKIKAEVASVFSDLRIRLDQYLLENAKYPTVTGSESNVWPTSPGTSTQTVFPLPTEWKPPNLAVRLSNNTDLYCGYAWITGDAADSTNIGPIAAAAPFNFTAPATLWYYLFAHCNIDGDTAVDSYYISDSVNTDIRVLNEGK